MLQKASARRIPAMRTGAVGEQVSVAVVDQIPLFREGLSVRVLRDPGMRLAGVTGHPNAAMMLRERLGVDVLVVDAMLDPRGRLAALLTESNSSLTVVMLVREPYLTRQFLASMLSAGVHGLVLHSSPPERILEAIRRSHREGHYLDPTLAPLVADGRGAAEPGTSGPTVRPLSQREYQVLQLISDGLSNQGVADALVLSVETVRTHIKGVLRKLAARDRAHAVAIGFRAGLLGQYGENVARPGGIDRRRPEVAGSDVTRADVPGSDVAVSVAAPRRPDDLTEPRMSMS
jgi:DNA-binding NarL/FixJ family response regulator